MDAPPVWPRAAHIVGAMLALLLVTMPAAAIDPGPFDPPVDLGCTTAVGGSCTFECIPAVWVSVTSVEAGGTAQAFCGGVRVAHCGGPTEPCPSGGVNTSLATDGLCVAGLWNKAACATDPVGPLQLVTEPQS